MRPRSRDLSCDPGLGNRLHAVARTQQAINFRVVSVTFAAAATRATAGTHSPVATKCRPWQTGRVTSFDAAARAATAHFDFPCAFGVTDLAGPIAFSGDVDAVFPFASVTKPLAGYAALVAVDRKLLRLDAPAGPEGSTVRHLLAHASGLPFEAGAILGAPGRRRVYSNRGFDVLGGVVEEATGTPFPEWLEETVLIPLGLSATECEGSPAHSGRGSVADLLAFGRETLSPTLVSAELWREAITPQFPGISGVLPGYGRQADNAWGLGVEIRDSKAPHWTDVSFPPSAYGHFGQSGSFLWVDPTVGRAGAFLGARPFGAPHREVWPALTKAMREA